MNERTPSSEDVSREPQKFMSEIEIKQSNIREIISNLENEKYPDFKKVFMAILKDVYGEFSTIENNNPSATILHEYYEVETSPEEALAKKEEVIDLIKENGYEFNDGAVTDKQGFLWSIHVTGGGGYEDWSCSCIKHDNPEKAKALLANGRDESMPAHYQHLPGGLLDFNK